MYIKNEVNDKYFGFIQEYSGICTSGKTIDGVKERLKMLFDNVTKRGLIDKFKRQ